jgi:hypothetical protein
MPCSALWSGIIALDGVKALKVVEQAHVDPVVAEMMMQRADERAPYEVTRSHPEWVPRSDATI